jgi:hypothetical protein
MEDDALKTRVAVIAFLVRVEVGWQAVRAYRSQRLRLLDLVGAWNGIDSRYVVDMVLAVKRHITMNPSLEASVDIFRFVLQVWTSDFSFQIKELATALIELCHLPSVEEIGEIVDLYGDVLRDAEDLLLAQCARWSKLLCAIGFLDDTAGLA